MNDYAILKDVILIIISSAITAIGILVIVIGSLVALYEFLVIVFKEGWSGRVFNEVRLDYAHYLILGLDFFIAKDLVDIIVGPGFKTLLNLLLIIVIRSFLSYFLHKDIINIQQTKHFHQK